MEDYRLEQSGQEVQDILNGAAMQSDLTAETERATEAEQTLQGNIDIEERDRKAADLTLQGNIDAEELRAKAAEKQNADDIDALEEKVPSGASASNKLATEEYVDDSVATATATFRGTYNLVSDLHLTVNATEQQIATALALAISTADNNDYCFVQVPTSSETPTEIKEINRYKFNGTAWSFEYKLNNSGFTAAQWAAINSGITSGDVTKLSALPTNAQLTTLLAGKQDVLTFDNVPTEGSSHPVKSGGVYSAIDDEKTAREGADSSLSSAIEAILLLIPSAATSLNKLADKAFVNSSIATASATFRGTYNLVTDLSLTVSATHAQIATALAGAVSDEDNNDYAFVQIPTSDATPTQIAKTERYKYNGTAWEYEYDLNNSGYTAAQWAAINSGITEALVTKLSALPTNADLTTALGVLTSSITAINQKIPSAASQANQLVDTAAMEAYIVQVLDVLTASFNVTSTDGHVTVQISQVDGKITSVSVSTSDIASASDLSLIAGRVTTAEGNISTNAADIANLQDAYAALTQSALVVIAPTDTWPVASPASKTIYRVVDRVNTPPQYYSDYMWNGTAMVLMATYDNAIDDVPTFASHNLVESGGVLRELSKLPYTKNDANQDLSISDEKGYDILQLKDGELKTKEFDSRNMKVKKSESDFSVSDEKGYDILQLKDGELKTKEFDSRNLKVKNKENGFSISDKKGYDVLQIENGELKTENFDTRNVVKDFSFPLYRLSTLLYTDVVSPNWVRNSQYITNNGNYGWDNKLILDREITVSDTRFCYDFAVDQNCIAYFGTVGSIYNTTSEKQTLISVNFSDGYLAIHNAVPVPYSMPSIVKRIYFDATGHANKKYRITISRGGRILNAELYDITTNVRKITVVSLGFSGSGNPCGLMYDRLMCFSETSDIKLYGFNISVPLKDKCRMIVEGDSITAGWVTGEDESFPFLLADNFTKNSVKVSGRGNGSIKNLINRLRGEVEELSPEIIMITIGTNNGFDSDLKEDFQTIVDFVCTTMGKRLILNHIPWNGLNNTLASHVNGIIDEVISENHNKNISCAKFDVATSLNYLNQEIDLSLFGSDEVHPNADGYRRMYEQIQKDIPDLFLTF